MKSRYSKLIFFALILLALSGAFTSPLALIAGFLFNLFFTTPYRQQQHQAINYLLKFAVIGLGFGMFISETIATGSKGFSLTLSTIVLTVFLGFILTKYLKIDLRLGHLITSGTAICGGSAIAAISPAIKANAKTISVSLAIVFMLNAIALFIFPVLGHAFHLSQEQFGIWCAVAIHDTSSVVGAALQYGEEALKIATTVKLTRTLWIIPMAVFSMFYFKTKNERVRVPYFIIFFVLAILAHSYHLLPELWAEGLVLLSKRLLLVSLLLIGINISLKDFKTIGLKPVALALVLWIFIATFSLLFILY
ncbi:YeiH family protein [Leeuwenhoekiella sp. ZYFB001]|uniref:YeiH family protein n=1 Tax=Leeuwenhoekiella sp. ZYFB001 TaxID=2719912 RepID=UPI001430DABA|nr:putative sulfate exporter family transporter [Leeuwenhoekiella sp. ZYFB001]